MSERTPTQCRKCGSLNVAWKQSGAGKWVLMNTTGERYSAQYLRGPHYLTCPGGTYADDMAEAAAALAEYKAANPDKF